jgi:hypothetical protein
MQPALQLLSARRLHSYELPPGWSCVAAVNPEDSDYQVNHLDPALRTRFMQISVCAERETWLLWAVRNNVHPVILQVVRDHQDAFADASPRSWAYTSDVLHALGPRELENADLIRAALRGFLPTSWSIAVAEAIEKAPEMPHFDPEQLFAAGGEVALAKLVRDLEKKNRIDAVVMISSRLRHALRRPELIESARAGTVTLSSLEKLVGSLPGDLRDQCLETAVDSAAEHLFAELGVRADDLVRSYAASPLRKELRSWREGMRLHRVRLVVTIARRWLDTVEDRELAAMSESLAALVKDAGILADDLGRSLRARGVELRG